MLRASHRAPSDERHFKLPSSPLPPPASAASVAEARGALAQMATQLAQLECTADHIEGGLADTRHLVDGVHNARALAQKVMRERLLARADELEDGLDEAARCWEESCAALDELEQLAGGAVPTSRDGGGSAPCGPKGVQRGEAEVLDAGVDSNIEEATAMLSLLESMTLQCNDLLQQR